MDNKKRANAALKRGSKCFTLAFEMINMEIERVLEQNKKLTDHLNIANLEIRKLRRQIEEYRDMLPAEDE